MYHAEYGVIKSIAALAGNVASVTWPSETIFKTDFIIENLFGVPRAISASGLAMDADRLAGITTALDGNQQKKIAFMIQTGMVSSALEHSVPTRVFSFVKTPFEGISAVKALQIANRQKVPIFTITKENIGKLESVLEVDDIVVSDVKAK